jgi:hypothetical protein
VTSPRLVLAGIVSLALLAASPGSASPLPDPDFIAKVDQLMLWIAERSNLEVPDHQPAFLFVSTETINYVAVGSLYNGNNPIVAAFSPIDAGLILLPAEGYTDDVLLHELVHFMQMTSGRIVTCKGDLEHEAYELQAQFTAETGIGEPVPAVSRILASMCPPPWQR